MALKKEDFANKLLSAIQNANSPETSQQAWCDAIASYIVLAYEAHGTYKGVLTSGSPDPLSSAPDYICKVASCKLSAGDVFNGLSSLQDPSQVLQKLSTNLTSALLANLQFDTTDSSSLLTFKPAVQATLVITLALSLATNPSDAMGAFAEQIITGLQSATPITPAIPTTTQGGAGTTTFSSFK